MKWFDKWIEKQYLKKHPKSVEPYIDPTISNECIIKVQEMKPIDIHAVVKLDVHDLSRLSEPDIYMCLCKCMHDQLIRCMHIESQYDYRSRELHLHSKIMAYVDELQRPDWFDRLKAEQGYIDGGD